MAQSFANQQGLLFAIRVQLRVAMAVNQRERIIRRGGTRLAVSDQEYFCSTGGCLIAVLSVFAHLMSLVVMGGSQNLEDRCAVLCAQAVPNRTNNDAWFLDR